MRAGWSVAVGMIALGLLPIIGQSVVSVMTALGDCRIPEGTAPACVIGGIDWGGLLQALAIAGRLFFLTAPIALAGFVLAIALALGSLMRRARS